MDLKYPSIALAILAISLAAYFASGEQDERGGTGEADEGADSGYINYFAYGSNLDEKTLSSRVRGEFPKRSSATLPGYRLAFSGAASIGQSEGGIVYGALYRLTGSQLMLLDRFEGVPRAYVRINVTAQSGGGQVSAVAYQFAQKREFRPPTGQYLQIIRKGYSDLGHPPEAFEALSRSARNES